MVGDEYTQVLSGLTPGQSVVLADYAEPVPSSNTNTNTPVGSADSPAEVVRRRWIRAVRLRRRRFRIQRTGGGRRRRVRRLTRWFDPIEKRRRRAGSPLSTTVATCPHPARPAEPRRHRRRGQPRLLPRLGLDFGPKRTPLGTAPRLGAPGHGSPSTSTSTARAFARDWDEGWPGGTGSSSASRSRRATRSTISWRTLAADGVPVQQPPYDAFWGARYAVVSDPDGNAVGIMSPVDDAHRSAPRPAGMSALDRRRHRRGHRDPHRAAATSTSTTTSST